MSRFMMGVLKVFCMLSFFVVTLFAEVYEGLWDSFVEEGPHVISIKGGGGMDGNFEIKLAMNSQSVLEPCVVWMHTPGDGSYRVQEAEIYFSRRSDATNKWSQPIRLTDNDFKEENVKFLVHSVPDLGDVYYVFYSHSKINDNSDEELVYITSTNGVDWSDPVVLASHYRIRDLYAVMSSDSSMHLMYSASDSLAEHPKIYYILREHYSASNWTAPMKIAGEENIKHTKPIFALDTTPVDDDIIYAAWHEAKGEYSDSQERIMVKRFSEDGSPWRSDEQPAEFQWVERVSAPAAITTVSTNVSSHKIYLINSSETEGTDYWQPYFHIYSFFDGKWFSPKKLTDTDTKCRDSFLLLNISKMGDGVVAAVWLEEWSGMKMRLVKKEGDFTGEKALSIPDWSKPSPDYSKIGYSAINGEYLKGVSYGDKAFFIWNFTSSWENEEDPMTYILQNWRSDEFLSLEEFYENIESQDADSEDSSNDGGSSDETEGGSCSLMFLNIPAK
ncbi:MAG: hypothetical protein R6W70_05555 [bacterium]